MSLTAPPRPPRPTDPVTHGEFDALVEALIKEARRRARRRRAGYAAALLLGLAGALAASVVIGGGGVSVGGVVADGSPASAANTSEQGRWIPSSGPGGGDVVALALDPRDSATLYAGSGGNVFRSSDAGKTWRNVTTGQSWTLVTALAVDPTRAATVYVSSDRGVAKTTNGGRSWSAVNTGLLDGLALAPDHSFIEGFAGHALFDSRRPGTVYLPTRRGLFRTTNGGARWRIVGPPDFRSFRVATMSAAIDPRSGTMYASWLTGRHHFADLYRSTDRGSTWHRVDIKGPHPWLESLVADPHRAGTLYAGRAYWRGRGGLMKSDDGGATWRKLGFAKQGVRWYGVDPGGRARVFVLTDMGAYSSNDGGVTWRRLGRQVLNAAGLAVDPRAPGTLYGADSDGLLKSADGGSTWRPINTGFVATEVRALALAHRNSATVYAGTWRGVYTSPDGGKSWRAALGGVAPTRVESLAVEQRRGGAVYAGTRGSGVFKSSDGGVTWTQVDWGLTANQIAALAIDPKHPRTVYAGGAAIDAAARASGVYKTTDGGATWRATALRAGVHALAIDPHDADTVFAGTTDGLFRSTDGGGSWTLVAQGGGGFQEVAIDSVSPDTVYAASVESVLKSIDGGDTWKPANAGLAKRYIDTLAVDPKDPRIVYVAGDGGVFTSVDSAQSWERFDGDPHVRTIVLPAAGRSFFAGTLGRGVVEFKRAG